MEDTELQPGATLVLCLRRAEPEWTPEERAIFRERGLGRYVLDKPELRSRRIDLRAGLEEHDPIPLGEPPPGVEAVHLDLAASTGCDGS